MFYPLIRNLLFRFDPEAVHHFSMNLLRGVCDLGPGKSLISGLYQYRKQNLAKQVFGLQFTNPVGLGAGFDKNALYLRELEALGFGFVEIGTVTPKPQPGNEQPRLFRLPADKALINRMGFNNNGVEAVKARLEAWRRQHPNSKMIVGGNIGKNKLTENGDAWKDYVICFDRLFDTADYFVVNVSSPNTPGLRALQEKPALEKIFGELQQINQGKPKPKPLLLKIAPDLTHEQLDDIIALTKDMQLAGLVATNTTISRAGLRTAPVEVEAMGMGGLSGKPVQQKSNEVLQYLVKGLGGNTPVIASGGIFTGTDAQEKMDIGASLIQVWTGFVYQGPAIAKNICKELR